MLNILEHFKKLSSLNDLEIIFQRTAFMKLELIDVKG